MSGLLGRPGRSGGPGRDDATAQRDRRSVRVTATAFPPGGVTVMWITSDRRLPIRRLAELFGRSTSFTVPPPDTRTTVTIGDFLAATADDVRCSAACTRDPAIGACTDSATPLAKTRLSETLPGTVSLPSAE